VEPFLRGRARTVILHQRLVGSGPVHVAAESFVRTKSGGQMPALQREARYYSAKLIFVFFISTLH
jgi:hypothetical protein